MMGRVSERGMGRGWNEERTAKDEGKEGEEGEEEGDAVVETRRMSEEENGYKLA